MRTRSRPTDAPANPATPVKVALLKQSSARKAPASKKKGKEHTSPYFVLKEEIVDINTSPYFACSPGIIRRELGDAAAGGTWHDLCIAPAEFRLQVSLMSGMLFRWVELPTTSTPLPSHAPSTITYVGVVGNHAVEMTETDNAVFYRVLGGGGDREGCDQATIAAVVKQEIFSLFSVGDASSAGVASSGSGISRAKLDPQFASADRAFHDRAELYRGLRVIKGDLFETIVSFLGSANNR